MVSKRVYILTIEVKIIESLCLGYNEIVNLLIQKGANINAVSRDRHTALIFAGERGNTSF